MNKLLSLISAASLAAAVAHAPVASAALCKTFAVPVSITNCTLPGGVGFASAFVNIRDARLTQWEVAANLFVGRSSSVLLLDKNGVTMTACAAGDNSPDGRFGTVQRCTTGAGVPKAANLYISL